MRPLISEELNMRINILVAKLFEANRIADRGMSVLDTGFTMNKTSKILHAKLAHLYPKLADDISDFQAQRNNLTVYLSTPLDSTDYPSPLAFFGEMLSFQLEIEALVYEVCEFAKDSDDYMTKVFLDKFMLSLIPVTFQLLLLVDKCEAYQDMMLFDANVEGFIIL